jgi:hypothetical protein
MLSHVSFDCDRRHDLHFDYTWLCDDFYSWRRVMMTAAATAIFAEVAAGDERRLLDGCNCDIRRGCCWRHFGQPLLPLLHSCEQNHDEADRVDSDVCG